MVTLTQMAQAYGYQGWIEFWGGMLCYFVVFNDFGFAPISLMALANVSMTKSNSGDVYNPDQITFGNTYLQNNYLSSCPSTSDGNRMMVDWVAITSANYDLRNTMLTCKLVGGNAVYSQMITWNNCIIQQISPINNLPVCFTTEACKYAQTAYFLGMVWGKILNFFVCKTRKESVITQGVSNTFMFFALTTELMLVLVVTYFSPFNVAFGLRDNIFMHYGMAALPFSMLQLGIDEVRKYMIRNLPIDNQGKPDWFSRAALW